MKPWLATALGLLGAAALYLAELASHDALAAQRARWPRIEERPAIPPPRTLRVVAGGFNEALADFYWARTLVYFGGGVAEKSSLRDTEGLLAVVNGLDPKFRRPYVWGGYATTMRGDGTSMADADPSDSIKVLERGVVAFPDDWELHWLLGLRYYLDVEVADPREQQAIKEKGVALIEKAMRLPGAPANIATLATTLRTRLGQKERALRELKELILSTEDGAAREELLARYRVMAAEGAEDLEAEGKRFLERRQAILPYATQGMFVLVGEPAPERSLAELDAPPADLLAAEDDASEPPPSENQVSP